MGKITAFSNQKGGVGKTTSCVNIAAYLAGFSKKVLLVDLDPQGNATTGLGVNKAEIENSIYSALIDDVPVKNCIVPTNIKNLSIIPSNIDLAGAEVELVPVSGREKKMKTTLDTIKNDFDFIFIDCPPSLGLLTVNALIASDSLIIPIQSEYYALEGLSQLMNTIKLVKKINPALEIDGVLITMYDGRSLISKDIAQEISKFFGKKLFAAYIPRNVRLNEAPSHGVPIMLHDPKCAGAKAYLQITEEYLARSGSR